MARRRVKLAFVTNSTTRKGTYQKRAKGLMKKVSELSILCNVEACAIVINPFNSQPEVWPNPSKVQHLIERFRSLPESERCKKMWDQEAFVRQRICKLNELLEKKFKENRNKEITDLMNQCLADRNLLQNLTPDDKKDLEAMISKKLIEVNARIEAIKTGATGGQHQVAAAPSPQPEMPATVSEMQPTGGTVQGQGQELVNPLDQMSPMQWQEQMSPMALFSAEWSNDSMDDMDICYADIEKEMLRTSMLPNPFDP